jgi:serine/threonine protein kinase/Tol biopolymer transport system component
MTTESQLGHDYSLPDLNRGFCRGPERTPWYNRLLMSGITVGSQLGPYEILAPLGVGGTGQVYRARDTRLGREVAIKVSSEKFSERFEREARVIASLNHPNICTLFDVGPDYLVMELIEGQTLAERIAESPVAVEETLGIAKQIAAALGEAHERGVIHRDLKPANVKLTSSGTVKVLDFGLAKVGQPEASLSPATGSPAESPTLTINATQAGMILGTAAYMSPEQARGKTVDKRTDIFAFGVVLYEMLSGQHPFKGESITDTLAAVIMKEPDLEAVPPRFRRVVQHCLQKEPHKRLRDISSVALLLDEGTLTESMLLTKPIPVPPPFPEPAIGESRRDRRREPRHLKWPAIAAISIAGMWFIFGNRAPNEAPAPAVARLTMDLTPAQMLRPTFYDRPSRPAIAISPDGSTIAFAGHDGNVSHLYKRVLAEERASIIEGTENADEPFFSRNGQWIGFVQGTKLRKVALGGGPPIDIAEIGNRMDGASWGDGIIVYRGADGIMKVADSGGTPELILERNPEAVVSARNAPVVLPGDDAILYADNDEAEWSKARIVTMDLDSKRTATVLENAGDPRYLASGHLAFLRGTDLLVVGFDPEDPDEVIGEPVPMVSNIMRAINAPNGGAETGMGQYAVSNSGTLVYAYGGIFPIPDTDLVRVNRAGVETKIATVKGALFNMRVSPDGKRLAVVNTLNGSRSPSLWLYDLATGGNPVRLTPQGTGTQPIWVPDGSGIAYAGRENKVLFLSLLAGAEPVPFKGGVTAVRPSSISADGKWLATLPPPEGVVVVPLDGTGEARKYGVPVANDPEFSPDGKWLAYRSDESGRGEIYVEPFPGPGQKRRISANGGVNPVWAGNGRELFFFEPGNRSVMMSIAISPEGVPGSARALFRGAYAVTTPTRSYDLTPQGDFILARPSGGEPIDQRVTKLNLVLGWGEEVKRRVAR